MNCPQYRLFANRSWGCRTSSLEEWFQGRHTDEARLHFFTFVRRNVCTLMKYYFLIVLMTSLRAVEAGFPNVVEVLIGRGAAVNAKGSSVSTSDKKWFATVLLLVLVTSNPLLLSQVVLSKKVHYISPQNRRKEICLPNTF